MEARSLLKGTGLPEQPDYSILDRPDILKVAFFPRRDWTPAPPGSRDYMVPVETDVSVSCRYYNVGESSPCVLLFHGNGEVACDYDVVAPSYHEQGVSLFVADYRGYGLSGGTPTFSAMMKDAQVILDFFLKEIKGDNPEFRLFPMGRSLGTHSALALVCHQDSFAGVILESGVAYMTRLISRAGVTLDTEAAKDFEERFQAQVQSITLPVLILHGVQDSLIPINEAMTLFNTVGSGQKWLVPIIDADHNSLLIAGKGQYFSAIRQFVFSERSDGLPEVRGLNGNK